MAKEIKVTDHLLQMAVAELNLSARIVNKLEDCNILTVIQLMYCCGRTCPCEKCPKEVCDVRIKISELPQMGKESVEQIYEALWLASQGGSDVDK